MIVNQENNNRLGVFFFYDGAGIADRYVEVLIREYSKCQKKLIIVSNGIVTEETMKMFQKYTNKIIIRKNEGLDFGAYYAAFMTEGWDKLSQYDEVSIMNSTLMGPVCSVQGMYDDMATKDLDFWGISKHFRFEDDVFGKMKTKYMPEHLQSHFLVFRSSLVSSKEFQDFWDNTGKKIKDYTDSVSLFEASFTEQFSNLGYKWDTVVSYDEFEGVTYNPIMERPVELLRKGLPFFKRRSLFQDHRVVLNTTTGLPTLDLFKYLEEETEYDLDMVWENAIRTMNHADFVKSLHLDYVLPSQLYINEGVEMQCKLALIMHIEHPEKLEVSMRYAKSMPQEAHIFVVSSLDWADRFRPTIESAVGRSVTLVTSEDASEISAIVAVEEMIKEYDLACFYHDEIGNIVKEEFYYKNANAVLRNKIYVSNIVNQFSKNKYLGMLVPLEPNHADYFPIAGNEWRQFFPEVRDALKKLKIKAQMHEYKEPVAPWGMMYWFRPKAVSVNQNIVQVLDELEVKKDMRTSVYKRMLPFICMHNGYHPGYVTSDYDARVELTNLRYYMQQYGRLMGRIGIHDGPQGEIIAKVDRKRVLFFSARFNVALMRFAALCQKLMPRKLYDRLIHIKRKIFGPYDLV